MEHYHSHLSHHHAHGSSNVREMKTAFWLNLSFTIIEFVGGIFTNSFAIITDAFHDLGDSIALAIGIWLEKYSKKEPTLRYTFGYKRFSLLSACILNTILIVGSGIMIFKSIENIINPEEVTSLGMAGLAFLGIMVNGLAFWRMNRANHKDSANKKAMTLHFLEDVLGWVAVLLGGILIYFTQWYWIDGVLSLGIALFILYNAIPSLISVFKIFLQVAPQKIDVPNLITEIKLVDKVQNLHQFYIWTEDGESHIATMHILISEKDIAHSDTIREELTKLLDAKHIHNVTIQIESVLCADHHIYG